MKRLLWPLAALLTLVAVGIAGASAIVVSHDASSITVKFDGYACGQTHTFTDDTGQSVVGSTDACPLPGFTASYWDNINLSGTPALVQNEANPPSYNWGSGSYRSGGPTDNFSARWVGDLAFVGG